MANGRGLTANRTGKIVFSYFRLFLPFAPLSLSIFYYNRWAQEQFYSNIIWFWSLSERYSVLLLFCVAVVGRAKRNTLPSLFCFSKRISIAVSRHGDSKADPLDTHTHTDGPTCLRWINSSSRAERLLHSEAKTQQKHGPPLFIMVINICCVELDSAWTRNSCRSQMYSNYSLFWLLFRRPRALILYIFIWTLYCH